MSEDKYKRANLGKLSRVASRAISIFQRNRNSNIEKGEEKNWGGEYGGGVYQIASLKIYLTPRQKQ